MNIRLITPAADPLCVWDDIPPFWLFSYYINRSIEKDTERIFYGVRYPGCPRHPGLYIPMWRYEELNLDYCEDQLVTGLVYIVRTTGICYNSDEPFFYPKLIRRITAEHEKMLKLAMNSKGFGSA